jgi:glycosyltransferase involved in cell wall biosynthesis
MKDNFSLTLVIPCYNEGKNIHRNVISIRNYLKSNIADFEIIAVNDGSTDNTHEELAKLTKNPGMPIKIIDKPENEGKGAADLAIPIEELPKFVAEIKNGSDIVIASRFIAKIKVLKPIIWYRNVMERVFRILRMVVINNYEVRDTQCGFKVFRREVALRIFPLLTIKRFSFDAEVMFLAKKMGLKVKELPITLQNPRESHIRIFADSWNMFWDLIKIRWNEKQGKYNTESRIKNHES